MSQTHNSPGANNASTAPAVSPSPGGEGRGEGGISSRPFFDTPERIADLWLEQNSWLGTPFHFAAAHKGVGVDCVHFPGAGLVNLGHLPAFAPPRYRLDGGAHETDSFVLRWLAGNPHFAQLPSEPSGPPADCLPCGDPIPARRPGPMPRRFQILPGDVLVFRLCLRAGVEWHVGWAASDERFLHVLERGAVREASLLDTTWANRLRAAFRPVIQAPTPEVHHG